MHPVALIATTIALVAWVYGGRRVVLALTGPYRLGPLSREVVVGALVVAGLTVPVALVGRWTGSFDGGLVGSAVSGVAVVLGARGRVAPVQADNVAPDLRRRVYVVTGLVLVIYAVISWSYQMHDEHALFGHKAIIEQLRFNEYPPHYPPLPHEEGRYHYGFDLLAGALARAYGLGSDWAIDLVSLGLVFLMSVAAAAVACEAGASRSAPFAAWAIHFGAGLAFVLLAGTEGRHPRCLVQYHHPTCGVELFPTQLLNVFQHPVAVGVPLFLVLVLLLPRLGGADDRAPGPMTARGLLLGGVCLLVLTACSMGQFVYYALGALAALSWFVVEYVVQRRSGRALSEATALVAVVGLSFVGAYAMGGMLADSPSIDRGLIVWRSTPGFPANEPVSGVLWHHVANLGVGFLSVPVLVVAAWRRRSAALTMLVLFALGGMTVPHLFNYVRSWDIVKFPSAASFALSMAYVIVIDSRWAHRPFPWSFARRLSRLLLCGSGMLAAVYLLFPLRGELRLYDRSHWTGDPIVRQTIRWWRDNGYTRDQVIYAQSNIARELSVFGGLSVVAQDSDFYYLGIRRDILSQQERWVGAVRRRMDRKALDGLGVTWLMFSNEELNNLLPAARKALDRPERFERMATFPAPTSERVRSIWRRRSRFPVLP